MDPLNTDPNFSGEYYLEPNTLETAKIDYDDAETKVRLNECHSDSINTDHYCVICGNNFDVLIVKQEVAGESDARGFLQASHPLEWTNEELVAFQWLLKWYRVKLSKKSLWKTGVDVFPFCIPCKFELKFLVDTQLKLKELDEALKRGIKDLKSKIASCEEVFKSRLIYKKDRRYRRLRAHIYRGKETPALSTVRRGPGRPRNDPISAEHLKSSRIQNVLPKVDLDEGGNTSKSGRRLKPVSRYNVGNEVSLEYLPKVVLSPGDKEKAERHTSLKAEVNPEAHLTDTLDNKERTPRQASFKRKNPKITTFDEGENAIQMQLEEPTFPLHENFDDDSDDEEKKVTVEKVKQKRAKKTKGEDRDKDFVLSEIDDVVDLESSNSDSDSDFEDLLPSGKRKRGPKKKKKDKNVQKTRRFPKKNCRICGKPCYGGWQIERHEWTHMSKEEKDAMYESGKVPKSLLGHYKPSFQCDECGAKFKMRFSFELHKLKVHTPIEEVAELCPHCGKSYKNLKTHIKGVHEREKNKMQFECGICGKVYPTRVGRSRHKQTVHMQLSRFTCTMCEKSRGFSSKAAYEQHMRADLNIRPFKCDQCDLAFTMKIVLNRHRKKFHEEGGNPRRPAYIRGRTKNAKFGVGILDRMPSNPEEQASSMPTGTDSTQVTETDKSVDHLVCQFLS